MLRVVLAIAVLAVSGCAKSKKPAEPVPTCAQMTDHMLEITKQQLAGHGDLNLDTQRQGMVDQCEKRNMPPEARKCLMAASTMEAIAACQPRSTDPSGTK